MKRTTVLILTALLSLGAATGACAEETYLTRASGKFGTGFLNVFTAWAELPKTTVLTAQSEGITGIPLGLFKGFFHMMGRTGMGFMDLATFYIPTKPMVVPAMIWEDFSRETGYNSNWELYETR